MSESKKRKDPPTTENGDIKKVKKDEELTKNGDIKIKVKIPEKPSNEKEVTKEKEDTEADKEKEDTEGSNGNGHTNNNNESDDDGSSEDEEDDDDDEDPADDTLCFLFHNSTNEKQKKIRVCKSLKDFIVANMKSFTTDVDYGKHKVAIKDVIKPITMDSREFIVDDSDYIVSHSVGTIKRRKSNQTESKVTTQENLDCFVGLKGYKNFSKDVVIMKITGELYDTTDAKTMKKLKENDTFRYGIHFITKTLFIKFVNPSNTEIEDFVGIKSNMGFFLNHYCNPNCVIKNAVVNYKNSMGRFKKGEASFDVFPVLVTNRSIVDQEMLLVDFDTPTTNNQNFMKDNLGEPIALSAHKCNCFSSKCRRSIIY